MYVIIIYKFKRNKDLELNLLIKMKRRNKCFNRQTVTFQFYGKLLNHRYRYNIDSCNNVQ